VRLIAWNTNYNSKRRSLEDSAELLDPLCPDILVLSETAPPCDNNPRGARMTGGTPGLAVIAREGLILSPHPANEESPPLMAGYTVTGDLDFSLLTVWPVQRDGGPRYRDILMTALDLYGDLLSTGRAIMAGDFNSNTRVKSQVDSHPSFVAEAESLGLVSAYHALTGEDHGAETISTYRHGSGESRDFHLDYCFVSRELVGGATLSVLRGGDWPSRSDHCPVVLDVPDALLG
jgi:exodeoxyribonuclease-3